MYILAIHYYISCCFFVSFLKILSKKKMILFFSYKFLIHLQKETFMFNLKLMPMIS